MRPEPRLLHHMQTVSSMPLKVIYWLALAACALSAGCRAQESAPAAVGKDGASLGGTVLDADGSMLSGARVEIKMPGVDLVETSDTAGEFHAVGLPAGLYTVRVQAAGFTNETQTGALAANEQVTLMPIELRMSGSVAAVTVYATQHEAAAAEVHAEEKQRVLGVIPNFYVVYSQHPVPLSPGQKFHLAWRSTLDPVSFLGTGFVAGYEQAANEFSGYGQGASGYGKRYAAGFADGAVAGFLGGAVLPVIFRQDPRYYYQGTGSIRSRTMHAVTSVVIAHGDNGKLQFNYSNVIGSFASAGISNLYYPASNRNGVGLTLGNAATGLGFGAFAALMQEFVVRKLTPHLPHRSTNSGQ
jgi:hypothetical protein